MNSQDTEMLNELVVESRDHLTAVEPDLLELEQKKGAVSDELINRVFRAVHSIKGGFGFFGIEHVTKLAHSMENALSRVRDKVLTITPELIDALLAGVDKLRVLLDDVNNAEQIPIETELGRMMPFVSGGPAATKSSSSPSSQGALGEEIRTKHPELNDQQIIDAVRHGKLLYRVQLNSATDMEDKNLTPMQLIDTWEKIGDILGIALDIDAITGLAGSSMEHLTYSVILASVLEPDLIGTGIDVPQEQISALDTSRIKKELAHQAAASKKQAAIAPDASPPAASNQVAAPDDKVAPTAPAAKRAEASAIEDALRVKVSLLNNLMNLAGELVLSRNQLLQSVNKPVSQSLESDRLFKDFDRQVMSSCGRITDAQHRNPGAVQEIAEAEAERIRAMFRQSMAFRIADMPGLKSVIQNIDLVTSMLQENIMQTRLQPISVLFGKFSRIVRDLAKKLGKEANLTVIGQEVELDKSIIEMLSDPLTHLVRNSVDHGIEMPADRTKKGKSAAGDVILRAYHEGGKVNIEISDDGAGINTARVKEKAVKLGLVKQEVAAKLSDAEINRFILLPGFSTAEIVSDVSGRGVGMDVVKTNIEKLGGTVEISSTPGNGTVIIMRLPLTLAIISSLVVTTEGKRFALPQVSIEELVRVRGTDVAQAIERVGRSEVYRLRGKLLPLVRLADVLGLTPSFVDPETDQRRPDRRSRWSDRRGNARTPAAPAPGSEKRDTQTPDRRENLRNAVKIVVLKSGDNRFGLVVDEVHDTEEIVVKPLSTFLKNCQCYAGATIMGDGSVAMILDTNGMVRQAELRFSELEKEAAEEKRRHEAESRRQFRDILLFDNGATERFGVELSHVSRIEKVDISRIEQVGSGEFLRYDDRTLPLIRLQNFLPVAAPISERAQVYVIVPKVAQQPLGLVVNQVEDVIHTDANLDTANVKGVGIAGSAIMNARMTILVDLPGLLAAAAERMG